MHTLKINFLIAALFLPLSLWAQTETVLQMDRSVAVFADHASEKRDLLLISENGQADFVNSERIVSSRRFRVTHPDCKPLTQNTVSMDAPGGLTLAYPFLVGADRVCMLNERTGTLRLLANFAAGLPTGTFSAVYAGTADNHSLFLINGREFPNATTGYIYLLKINKSTLQVELQKIIQGVPGYSGGMFYDSQKIWINSYPGKLYRLLTEDLHTLIRSRRLADFSEVAVESFRIGNGLSSYMLSNDTHFLYSNDDYESYFIEKRTGFRYVTQPPCPPVSGHGRQWLILCGKNSLQRWTPAIK